jgi:hypothetical protein
MNENEILFENGEYWVEAAEFGTGRFKPKSKGFIVWKQGITHSTKVASVSTLDRAKEEIQRRLTVPPDVTA